MDFKKPGGIVTVIVIMLVITGVAVAAGTVYFYILPNHSGTYSGPGLPNPGVTTSFTVSVSGYADWADYGFHSNVSNFWVNLTLTGINSENYNTALFGLMNQSEYNNLSTNTSISWLYGGSWQAIAGANWHVSTGAGNYYLVLIQEGNGGLSATFKLTLTQL
jgi:hypothetical protein